MGDADAASMRLYTEARIRADLDELWDRTQDPLRCPRWDLRFSAIEHLTPTAGEPTRFRYATRVLPFLTVDGTGVFAEEHDRLDGTRTRVLRLGSPHPLSPLAEGRGYWRVVPDGDAVRFLTGYDYRPRGGRAGALADRLLIRPLIGWATAWSLDRLRLWLERGVTPERARRNWLTELLLRALVAAAACACFGYGRALPLHGSLAPLFFFATPPLALVALGLALFAPPLPGTPAARRCLRAPSTCAGTTPRLPRGLERSV